MNEFLQDIKTRYGDNAALITELWINFYIFGNNADYSDDYARFVKAQMGILINHTSMDAKLFNTLVNESNTFLQKFGQTIH